MNYVFGYINIDSDVQTIIIKIVFLLCGKKLKNVLIKKRIISVREAGKEIDKYHAVDDLTKWKLSNPSFFPHLRRKKQNLLQRFFLFGTFNVSG